MRLLRLSQTADAGLRFAGVNAGVRVGSMTAPLSIWDRMHALDAKAQSLDKNIQAYVRDPNLKQRYNEWYTVWRSLYDAIAAPNQARPDLSSSRQAELTSLVGDHEREFESILYSYNALGQQPGAGVPAVTYAPIVVASSAAPTKTGLPWWFWVAGGVFVFGVGYVVYRKYQEGKAKAAYIHKEAPGLLEKYLPGYGSKAYGYTQAGRDPDSAESAPAIGAKIPPQHDPLRLDYYAAPREENTAFGRAPERDPEPTRPEPEENLGTYDLEEEESFEPSYTPYRHRGYGGFGYGARAAAFGRGRGAPFGRVPGYLDDEEIY